MAVMCLVEEVGILNELHTVIGYNTVDHALAVTESTININRCLYTESQITESYVLIN